MLDITLICTAAFFAGVLNSIAGGGSFLTLPALVFIGVPPIAANATSTVAVFPGYLSSAFGFRNWIKTFNRKELMLLMTLSVAGGIVGAVLLLVTSAEAFDFIVPWLLLFATLLFALDKKIRKWTTTDTGGNPAKKIVATLAITTYGGYFNGGLGIMLLALFAMIGFRDINLMNGLKSMLSSILSVTAVVTFAIAGIVYWKEAMVMMVATAIGGYMGAIIAQRLPVEAIRFIVIIIGLGMTVAFFLRQEVHLLLSF